MGDDIGATQDRTIAKSMKSKDGKSEYILEEDVYRRYEIIKKNYKESDDMVTDEKLCNIAKVKQMNLLKVKNQQIL